MINERKIHRYLLVAIVVVHVIGLFVDIMDVDATQYASLSMEMLKDGHWLQVHERHANYLDKPPLLFWLSAISYKLFGISNFTYKLPSFLFAMIGIFSTYKLTTIYYGRRAGRIAAIIIGSVQAMYSITQDVRTDTILLGSVVFAIWQLVSYIRKGAFKNLVLGFIGISLAMLAKGPIGLMVPVLAIGTDLVLRQKWKDLLKWQWFIGLGIIIVMLLPMSYGLYEQFDKHPEAIANHKTGVSGLYFYFWEQSFGRLTGENVWTDNTGPLYFVHTSLWAFLPWTIVLIGALGDRIRHIKIRSLQSEDVKYPEYLSLGGFILPFIAFSMSHFKLPHYIYVIYPLGAMLSAAYLDKIGLKGNQILKKIQLFVLFVMWVIVFLLLFYIFTPTNIAVALVAILIFGVAIWAFVKLPQSMVFVVVSAITAIGANFVLSGYAYPRLLTYQSTSEVGKWLKNHPEEKSRFAYFKIHTPATDFYGRDIFPLVDTVTMLSQKYQFLYTDVEGLAELKGGNVPYVIMKEYDDFAVTRLNATFLNPTTRLAATNKRYLLAIYQATE